MSRIRDDSSRQATKGDLYEEVASAKRQDNPKKKSVGSKDEKKPKRAAKARSKATNSGVPLRRFSGRQVIPRESSSTKHFDRGEGQGEAGEAFNNRVGVAANAV